MSLKTPLFVLRLLIFLVIVIITLAFTLKNNTPATLQLFMDKEWDTSLSILLLLGLLVGFAMGFSAGGVGVFRAMRWRERRLKQKWETKLQAAEKQKADNTLKDITPNTLEQKALTSPANATILPST